jgi:hypothetical protein
LDTQWKDNKFQEIVYFPLHIVEAQHQLLNGHSVVKK